MICLALLGCGAAPPVATSNVEPAPAALSPTVDHAAMPSNTKRGAAYHFCGWPFSRGESELRAMVPGLSWYYNWSSKPMACADGTGVGGSTLLADSTVEFVPMAWGLVDDGRACASGGSCFRVDERAGGLSCHETCKANSWSFHPDGPCYGCLHEGVSRDAFLRDIPANAKHLLGFNEPNFKEQANLTPEAAANAWRHVEWVADKRQLKLVGPATNFCDPTPGAQHPGACIEAVAGDAMLGFAWLERFYDACSAGGSAGHDCRIDFQAVHAYSCSDVTGMIALMKGKAGLSAPRAPHCSNGVRDADEFATDCGGNVCTACSARARAIFAKSVWLTEFAPTKDDCGGITERAQLEQRALQFMKSELPALNADPYVYRYAWFMPKTDMTNLDHVDLLVEQSPGHLTPLGAFYFARPRPAGARPSK